MKILVLCGGSSPERVVSLASGDEVGKWLAEAGYEAAKYDPEMPGVVHGVLTKLAPEQIGVAAPPPAGNGKLNTKVVRGLLDVIEIEKPDAVFPILHGGYGENGVLQALLDWVGIPYTGSGTLSSSMAMNKHVACKLMAAAGVPVPQGFVIHRSEFEVPMFAAKIESLFGYPAVIKPLNGGSTVGLTKVRDRSDLAAAVAAIREQGDDALVESHFTGRELTVTVIEGDAYPIVEIRPREGFYDYTNKYSDERTDYLCPAPITERETREIQAAAVTAFHALGCAGFARIDFLLANSGEFICLEVNTLPGMTTHSLVPMAVRAKGETLPQMMRRLVDGALKTLSRTM
jgi:D-alanine-D-alanine ligase